MVIVISGVSIAFLLVNTNGMLDSKVNNMLLIDRNTYPNNSSDDSVRIIDFDKIIPVKFDNSDKIKTIQENDIKVSYKCIKYDDENACFEYNIKIDDVFNFDYHSSDEGCGKSIFLYRYNEYFVLYEVNGCGTPAPLVVYKNRNIVYENQLVTDYVYESSNARPFIKNGYLYFTDVDNNDDLMSNYNIKALDFNNNANISVITSFSAPTYGGIN